MPGKLPYRELDDRDSASDAAVADDWWSYDRERNDSVIRDVFAGQLRSAVRCSSCGKVSRAFDSFWDLGLNIPRAAQVRDRRSTWGGSALESDACSLDDCLGDFVREESLAGDASYKCARCGARNASKAMVRRLVMLGTARQRTMMIPRFESARQAFWRLPRVLVVVLKRFSYSAFRRAKITTAVEVPTVGVDLAPYCAKGGAFRTRPRAHLKRMKLIRWVVMSVCTFDGVCVCMRTGGPRSSSGSSRRDAVRRDRRSQPHGILAWRALHGRLSQPGRWSVV